MAYDHDREVIVAECDTAPGEILKAVKRKTMRQQVGNRVFYIKRFGDVRIRENYQEKGTGCG
jgi:hypothetical protein